MYPDDDGLLSIMLHLGLIANSAPWGCWNSTECRIRHRDTGGTHVQQGKVTGKRGQMGA